MRAADFIVGVGTCLGLICWGVTPPACGEITRLSGHSYASGVVPDTTTNDLSIDFAGSYTGAQLVIQLEAGSIFQHEFGGSMPPPEALVGVIPELAFDSFVAQGTNVSNDSFSVWEGAVNLGGAATEQFDGEGVNQFWSPRLGDAGPSLFGQTNFFSARITLSDDALGSWSYLAAADGLFGVVESMPIVNGQMQVPVAGDYNNNGQVEQMDLDLVLLNWGTAIPPVPAGWVSDIPDLHPGYIGQRELDRVLLNWSEVAGAQEHWSVVPNRVDPRESGGQLTGLWGDFNGSGQVEQADWDLVYSNYGESFGPAPEGWVNDPLEPGTLIGCCMVLDRVFLNWGNTVATSSLSVPEPSCLAPLGLAVLLLPMRRR